MSALRVLVLVAIVTPMTAGLATGQFHASGYFGVTWATGGSSYGVHLDTQGNVTSLRLGGASHYAVKTYADNKLMLVLDTASRSLWTVDPQALTVVGTVFSNPALSSTAYGIHYDCNGDLLVFDGSRLFRIDSALTTLTTVTTGSFGLGNGNIDVYTGDLLIASGGSIRSHDRRSGAATTLGTGTVTRYGSLAQDARNADLYIPTCCGATSGGRSLDVLRGGGSVTSIWFSDLNLLGAYGVNMDRISAASPRLISGCFKRTTLATSGGFWSIDVQSQQRNQIGAFPTATIADVDFIAGRNIHVRRTAPAKYTVQLDLPFDGGNPYILGFTASGVRPMLPLPDGRRIPIVFDSFTTLTAQGLGAPFVRGTLGALNALGQGSASIDLSSIYPAVRGLRLWMVLVTISSQAPLGIATITDPFVLNVD